MGGDEKNDDALDSGWREESPRIPYNWGKLNSYACFWLLFIYYYFNIFFL